jgi:hypothetical protein
MWLNDRCNVGDIASDLATPCNCDVHCTSLFTVRAVQAARQALFTLTHLQLTLALIGLLCTMYNREVDELMLMVNGRIVCDAAFVLFHGITMYKFKTALSHVISGTSSKLALITH